MIGARRQGGREKGQGRPGELEAAGVADLDEEGRKLTQKTQQHRRRDDAILCIKAEPHVRSGRESGGADYWLGTRS